MSQDQVQENAGARGGDQELDVAEMVEQARDRVEDFVQEQPHAALGLAAVAGFILGGGLTPRRLFRLGMAAGGPALSRQIFDQVVRIASETLEGDHGRATPKRPASHSRRAKSEV